MTRFLLAIAICLGVASLSATPVEAKSQREKATLQFESLWNARLSEYRTTASATGAEHKAASDAILSNPPFVFANDDARLGRLIQSAEADAKISGRGEELSAFAAEIASRPSLGLIGAYLQGRVQKSTEAADSAEQARLSLATMVHSKSVTVGQLLVEVERMAMARGAAIGRNAELELIIENYGSYANDMADASERDRENRARWAAALGAAGRAMASNPTWSASCVSSSNMVSCVGR